MKIKEELEQYYVKQYLKDCLALKIPANDCKLKEADIYGAFMHGAKCAEKIMVDKACDILENMISEIYIRYMRGEEIKDIISDFRKEMEE